MRVGPLVLLAVGGREPKTVLRGRGALVLHEKFEGTGFPKSRQRVVGNGTLKGAELPEEKHRAYASRKKE